jgi:hypothetical protein
MKNIKFLLTSLFFILTISVKTNAQTENDEAVLTYQMAEEEYDKGNFNKAIFYLDKVEKISEEAKVRTSYLRAKCIDKLLDLTPNNETYLYQGIQAIEYYFNNGKDDSKKKELLKIKIKIENSDNYQLAKEFLNMSKDDAFKLLVEAKIKYPNERPYQKMSAEQSYKILSRVKFDQNYFYQIFVDGSTYNGMVHVYIILLDLHNNSIALNNNAWVFSKPIEIEDRFTYDNVKRFEKYFDEDTTNYFNNNYSTHGRGDVLREYLTKEAWQERNYGDNRSVNSFLDAIYDTKKADDNFNNRMIYALKTVLKK